VSILRIFMKTNLHSSETNRIFTFTFRKIFAKRCGKKGGFLLTCTATFFRLLFSALLLCSSVVVITSRFFSAGWG